MKYKDYYKVLGVERDASADAIKKAYRKLAQKHHPDVSKDTGAEANFKEIGEAYQTLKDPEKRAAYDQLGVRKPGEEFQPGAEWGQRYGPQGAGGFEGFSGAFSSEDFDIGDLFESLRGRRAGRPPNAPVPGQNFDVDAAISLDDAYRGTMLDLRLQVPDYDEQGRMRRVERNFKARIPKGATDGQRLRLRGQGGKGSNGGPNGDLFLNIRLRPHPWYRVDGHDLFLDLPVAPWEAALGASVEVPTPGGPVKLKIPASTNSGQKLRLSGRGLPKPGGGDGDLYAIVQIVTPQSLGERELALFRELAEKSTFDPRGHFQAERSAP